MNTTVARLLAAGGLVAIIVAAIILAWPPTRLALMMGGDWGLATSDPMTQLGLGLFVIGLIGWLSGGTALRLSRAKRIAQTQPTDHGESEPRARAGLSASDIYFLIAFIVFVVSFVGMAILRTHYADFEQFGLAEQGYLTLFFASCALSCVSLIAMVIIYKRSEQKNHTG